MTQSRKWVPLVLLLVLAAMVVQAPDLARANEDITLPLLCVHQDSGPPNNGCQNGVPWGSALYSLPIPGAGTMQISAYWGYGQGCVRAERFYPANGGLYSYAKQTGLAIHNCPGYLGISRTDVAIEVYRNPPLQFKMPPPYYGTEYIYVWIGGDGKALMALHWRGPGCLFCYTS